MTWRTQSDTHMRNITVRVTGGTDLRLQHALFLEQDLKTSLRPGNQLVDLWLNLVRKVRLVFPDGSLVN